ncbi:MAG: hypothetical protein V4735_03770 [Pseudomonadota bacterium]
MTRRTAIQRAALMMGMLLLCACGFQPLHSQAYQSSLAVDLSALDITATGSNANSGTTTLGLDRRYGELLKAEIESQINPAANRSEKLFHVDITFTELEVALFVNPDGTASRGDLLFTSSYTISRLADGKALTSGSLQRTSSYNTSPTADYASYVSIEDARKRGIMELAQDYKLRLATSLKTLNDPITVKPEDALTPVPALQQPRGYEDRPPGY